MTRQARYIVRKADHVGGNPIPEDEPCIVIRAQDVLALSMADEYLERYRRSPSPDPQVYDELMQHRLAIAEWQETHGTKWADR